MPGGGLRLGLAALLLLLGGAGSAHAAPAVVVGAGPESYALDLHYEPETLRGSERIEFVNRGDTPLDRVWLRLWANGPDRCRPSRIDVRLASPAEPGHERCSALEVRLGAPVRPGASGAVSLDFTVRVRKQNDRFGRAWKTALLGNVVPVLAVEDDRGLHLPPYTARSESFYSLSARWEATLRLPARLRAATTGAVVSERVRRGTRTLRVATPQARDFALAIGPLRVTTTRVDGVRIRAFTERRPQVLPARLIRAALGDARRTVATLGRSLAPYGSTELDLVLAPVSFAGMEYPEVVFALPLPEVIAHEVAHQWWYGLVGNDQYDDPWLDESFATYWEQRLDPGSGECDPDRPYSVVAPQRRQIPLDASMAVFDRAAPSAIGEIVYGAGSCALQRLER
ncbi:MAG: hypothetical protein QOE60_1947, partial [Thermoleophilaceae bacterium]|nr:hypothetical protein [Thermoleophilaceae bacterium]